MSLSPLSVDRVVNCGSCKACCKGQIVMLEPEDDPAKYQVETMTGPRGTLHILQHKANGDCAHLGPGGCEVYHDRPMVCRFFDCVEFAEQWPRVRRRAQKMDTAVNEIFKAGQTRLLARRKAVSSLEHQIR